MPRFYILLATAILVVVIAGFVSSIFPNITNGGLLIVIAVLAFGLLFLVSKK